MKHFDLMIVGGGLVGASLACAVGPLGYKVAVIEASAPRNTSPPSYDDRTLALGLASCRILQGLDLWPGIAPYATPIRQVIVSELARPGRVTLDPAELGLELFGHVVEARAFGQAVMDRLNRLSGVDVVQPAKVVGIDVRESEVALEIEQGEGRETLTGQLAVAADGTHSAIRELLGLSVREKDYRRSAVICNVTPQKAHEGRAFERMTRTGPFALLPFSEGRCGLVWTVPTGDADKLMQLPEADFLAAASERSGSVLGTLKAMGRRSQYPLELLYPEQIFARRTVLIGNAAHTLHPVGAQGFNLGLRDVAALAEVLAEDRRDAPAHDPGDETLLRKYSRWREPDTRATTTYTDGLASIFGSVMPLTEQLRSMGMLACAMLPPLRRELASRAMGYRGRRSPRLALGDRLFEAST